MESVLKDDGTTRVEDASRAYYAVNVASHVAMQVCFYLQINRDRSIFTARTYFQHFLRCFILVNAEL
jgi:hypothetical protein